MRQRRQDIQTQLAVTVQGYMALDLIRRNNLELIRGVDRAQTTTIAALRTAVIVSQALSQDTRLDASGRLVFKDGKPSAELSTKLAAAFNGTKLSGEGTLKLVDGKPEAKVALNALFSAGDSGGGIGISSSWCTARAPWRCAVPRQSAPVSPPPMMTTC